MQRALVLGLVVMTASVAAADDRLGPLRFSEPEQRNGGPDRYGVNRLRFIVENPSDAPVEIEAITVRVRTRRVMDEAWTHETERVPGALFLESGSDTGSLRASIPPGRHVLVVRFDRVPASAYHVHLAEIRLRSRHGAATVALAVATTRRHPLPHP